MQNEVIRWATLQPGFISTRAHPNSVPLHTVHPLHPHRLTVAYNLHLRRPSNSRQRIVHRSSCRCFANALWFNRIELERCAVELPFPEVHHHHTCGQPTIARTHSSQCRSTSESTRTFGVVIVVTVVGAPMDDIRPGGQCAHSRRVSSLKRPGA